jgi:transposase
VRQRERWRRHQGKIDPNRLVFIDETWVKTNMAPLRGWGQRGARLIAHVPHGHWRTMTFIAALRSDRIDAPWVLNGPVNANAFLTYVEKELVKTLSPKDIIVLDNLGSHKGQAVRQAIRRVGARMIFLPPYSPDLNPIEQLFSKIKHAMRTAMARSEHAVHAALAETIRAIPPAECANYIQNAGYGST